MEISVAVAAYRCISRIKLLIGKVLPAYEQNFCNISVKNVGPKTSQPIYKKITKNFWPRKWNLALSAHTNP